jgi:hypothetical protein
MVIQSTSADFLLTLTLQFTTQFSFCGLCVSCSLLLLLLVLLDSSLA